MEPNSQQVVKRLALFVDSNSPVSYMGRVADLLARFLWSWACPDKSEVSSWSVKSPVKHTVGVQSMERGAGQWSELVILHVFSNQPSCLLNTATPKVSDRWSSAHHASAYGFLTSWWYKSCVHQMEFVLGMLSLRLSLGWQYVVW